MQLRRSARGLKNGLAFSWFESELVASPEIGVMQLDQCLVLSVIVVQPVGS